MQQLKEMEMSPKYAKGDTNVNKVPSEKAKIPKKYKTTI